MSTPSTAQPQAQRRPPPIRKYGRVAIWRNQQGLTITISPRRFRDAKTGEWREVTWDRPADVHELVFCLQKAVDFAYEAQLPSLENDDPPEAEGSR